jgi:hypothetical protein
MRLFENCVLWWLTATSWGPTSARIEVRRQPHMNLKTSVSSVRNPSVTFGWTTWIRTRKSEANDGHARIHRVRPTI